jgi:unsaturated chondroitin disaccharide hydrolase
MSTALELAWAHYVRLARQEQDRNGRHLGQYPHYMEEGRWRRFPIDATSGWVDDSFYDHGNWTAGFAVGQAWLAAIGDPDHHATVATQTTALLDVATRASDRTTHDLGFLFHPSFALGEQLGFLTSDAVAPAHEAAESLAARFNPAGGYLQAFGPADDPRSRGTSTIDTMMNLPLLWWSAADGQSDVRRNAETHARTSAREFFRPDGSTYHLIKFDPSTGVVLERGTFQGGADDSCWSRGQAWAIAGFAWSYAVQPVPEFLDAALTAWNYFRGRIPDDGVVPWDFGAPSTDTTGDASASAIAALGALILSEQVESTAHSAELRSDAERILEQLSHHAVRQDPAADGILLRSCYSKPHGLGLSGALPYGDYYYGLALALATGRIDLSRLTGVSSQREKLEQ